MGETSGDANPISLELLTTLDDVWERLSGRLAGLTEAEYLWEPAAAGWSVRVGPDGSVRADMSPDDPLPAPITTIAWRLWHIAVDCMDGYTSRLSAPAATGHSGASWVLDPSAAIELTGAAVTAFRTMIETGGDVGLWLLLGEAWGPYADSTRMALVLHAIDELSHHGAEIALLRDLYATTPEAR